jgi:HPr kinase/phosphorylase
MTRGIVLMGESGSGKSRLALSLLYEGARLVADDVVDLSLGTNGLIGRSPDRLRGLIEIRGVGIVDVSKALGRSFVLEATSIDLAVSLEKRAEGKRRADSPEVSLVTLLGREIPDIRVGSDIDVRVLMSIIADVILGGSGGSSTLRELVVPPR